MVKETACQCRRCKRCCLTPGSRRSLRVGNGNPLRYSCLGNPKDRGAWQGHKKSDTTEHKTGKFCDLKTQFLLSNVNKVQFPSCPFIYCGPFTLDPMHLPYWRQRFPICLITLWIWVFYHTSSLIWNLLVPFSSLFFNSYSYLLGEVFPDSLKKTN